MGRPEMQTTFTLAQLADPDVAEADKILRACVHCGFCTATCPTYVLLGDELDSPRGRIYLIKDMLENDRPADCRGRQAHRPLPLVPCLHDDLPVGRALHAPRRSCARPHRGDLRAAVARPADARACWPRCCPIRAGSGRRLRPPGCRGASRRSLRPAPATARAKPCRSGGGWCVLRPPAAMLALTPARLGGVPPLRPFAPEGPRKGRVALLQGCAQAVLAPSINEAAIRLLTRQGIEVVLAAGEGCCGVAGASHGARSPSARAGAREHRCVDARDRKRRARCNPSHDVGLRNNHQGLRLHAAQRSGLCGKGRACVGARAGHLGVSGAARARSRRGPRPD